MSRFVPLGLSLLAATVVAQQPGAYTPEVHPILPTQQCTRAGGCKTVQTSIVLDSNYRWMHNVGGYDSCSPSNPTYCSNVTACAQNCAIEGVDYQDNGIFVNGGALTLNLFTKNGTQATSPRVYLLHNETTYEMLRLTNREITYDVDVSRVGCGVNGALYLSEMTATGDASDLNKAGAKYGTGYCDAQCPKNNFVKGLANINGTYGACCNEMDLWEANRETNALTPHPCDATAVKACTGAACSNDLKVGTCDQGGCDFNPYRNGRHDFYGPKKQVDTTRPFTVITQFQTDNGKDDGNLITINRFYKQDGKFFLTPSMNITGAGNWYNSIYQDYCDAEDKAFGGNGQYPFKARGGLTQMGKALERGMVLIFSIWEDNGSGMQWLDGVTGDVSQPGNLRGPCNATSGEAAGIQLYNSDASVTWSNIKIGEFSTTF